MIKTLVRHGNSQALVFEKSILKLLNIESDTKLKIEIKDQSLVITPVKEKMKKKKGKPSFQESLEEIIAKYSKAFKKLAKH